MAVALPFVLWATSGTFWANTFLFAFRIVSWALVSFAVTSVAKSFMKKPTASLNTNSPLQMTKEPTPVRRVVYGETRVSGPLLFAHIAGTNNEMLHYIVPLATHECGELGTVYFSDKEVPLDGAGNATGELAGYARIIKHLGAIGQAADSTLIAETGIVTSDDRFDGSAYLYIRCKWDQNRFPGGIPNPTCIVKGALVYDPRTETVGWSDNVALCVRDYLTNAVYGLGVSVDELDESSFITAANICDEEVSLAGGGTEKRYTCNGSFELSAEPGTVLEKLAASMAGWVVYVGGKWICQAGAHETPTLTLDESDLRGPMTVQTKLSMRDTCNLVKGTFISPEINYQPDDFEAVTDAAYVTEDNGIEIPADLDFPFTTSHPMSRRLARIHLKRTRLDTTVQMPCKLTALRARAGSTVMVNNTRYGYAAKQFIVVGLKFVTYGEGALGVDLLLRETNADVYQETAESVYVPGDLTNFDDITTVPTPTGLALTTANVMQNDGVVTSRLRAIWNAAPNRFVLSGGYVHIEYKRHDSADWLVWTSTLRGDATQDYITDVRAGDAYDVRARFENSQRKAGSYAEVSDFTLSTDTTVPTTPSGFSAAASPASATLRWDACPDDDYWLSRVYRRAASETDDIAGATLVWAGNATTWTDFIVSVGVAYRYWVRHVDESGNESAASGSATATPADATGNFIDYRFKMSVTQPSTPSGDDPSGWVDDPADATGPGVLWMIKGEKTASRVLVGTWSGAVQITGPQGQDGIDGADGEDGDSLELQYSVDGVSDWHFPAEAGDKYGRQRLTSGDWSIAFKIVGEDGESSTINQVAGPVFSFDPPKYSSSSSTSTCELTCDTAGASIFYSYDGQTKPYTGPFTVTRMIDIVAWASKSGMVDSVTRYDLYEDNT